MTPNPSAEGETMNNDSQRIRLLPEGESKTAKLGDVQTEEQVRRTIFVSLSVCSFYILISSSMVFTNKALSYSYNFRTTNVLLFLQMIFTVMILRLLRSFRVISFVDFEMNRAKQVAPVSIFYSLNAAVALVALRELSVPSYTLIKRLAPLFTICLEAILLKKFATRGIVLALIVMAVGTVLAANADSSSSAFAWFLGFMSCAFQALYLTFVKRSGIDTGMNSFGILYYHSILSIPCMALIIFGTGELVPAIKYDQWHSPTFIIVLVASLLMGFLLNYALFLCTELTSPTSTVVSGQVKAMGQTAVGMFTFGGVDMNMRYLCGTVLNITGGVLYAIAKLKSIRERG